MKKFAKFIVCCLLLPLVFVGCTLFETDKKSYYSQIVAKDSAGYTVTMEELLNSFSNNGATYISSYGLSAQDAFERVIKDVVDRKILLDYVDKNCEDFTEKYSYRAKKETYETINSQIENYENIAKKELYPDDVNADEEEDESTTETNSTYILTKYESAFDLDESGNVVFADVEEEEEAFPDGDVGEFSYTSAGAVEGAKQSNLKAYRIFVEGKAKYFANARKYYKSLGYENLTDDELLQKEIDRIYKIKYENEKITYLQKYYDNVIARNDESLSKVKTDVYNYYVETFEKAKETYELVGNYQTYLNNATSTSRTTMIDYHPDSGKVFLVSHILLQFEEEDQKEISRLEEMIKNDGASQADLDTFKESAYSRIRTKARDLTTGVVDQDATEYTPETLLDYITSTISGLTNAKDKMEKFGEFVYMYNEDPGIMSSLNGYAIPTQAGLDAGLTDTMVSEFATASRELRGNGESANLGNFSGLVKTTYGYHIIMYIGEVENVADESYFTSIEETIKRLFDVRVRGDLNKTYLDYFYEKAVSTSSNYNEFLQDIIDTARNNVDTKIYKTRIKKEVKKYS